MIDQIQDLSETELLALKEQAENVLHERKNAKKSEAVAQIKRIASEYGLQVEITKADNGNVRPIRKVEPKYRNPANPAETWSGRGKKPQWVSEALKTYLLDQLKIAA